MVYVVLATAVSYENPDIVEILGVFDTKEKAVKVVDAVKATHKWSSVELIEKNVQ